jgi:hypothetical protein
MDGDGSCGGVARFTLIWSPWGSTPDGSLSVHEDDMPKTLFPTIPDRSGFVPDLR